jgi:RNA polymerase sigma-70 factor (ECF subfamily)
MSKTPGQRFATIPVTMSASDTTHSLPTPKSLLSRLRDADDHASWQRFFDLYWRLLYNVSRRAGLKEAEAEDVVQETVIYVARQMPEFRYDPQRGSFKAWLLAIVRSRIADHFRRQHYRLHGQRLPRQQSLDTVVEETHPLPSTDLDILWGEEWERHLMNTALSLLKTRASPLQFQAFQLHVLEGLPAEVVARKLGLHRPQVYWAKYRLGKILRVALREAEDGSAVIGR